MPILYPIHGRIPPGFFVGSITSHCSGKWAHTRPSSSGRIKDRTRETAEIKPSFFATFKNDLQVLIFKMELYWNSPVIEEKSTWWLHVDVDILLQLAEISKSYFKEYSEIWGLPAPKKITIHFINWMTTCILHVSWESAPSRKAPCPRGTPI